MGCTCNRIPPWTPCCHTLLGDAECQEVRTVIFTMSPPVTTIEFGAFEFLFALITVPFYCCGLAESMSIDTSKPLTVLCRCPTQPYTLQVKPFFLAVVTIAANHFAVADPLAIAVPFLSWSILFIFLTLH